jgi:hypothetical protein
VISGSGEPSSYDPISTTLDDNDNQKRSYPTYESWEANKTFIKYLYITKGATLREVQAALKVTGFKATYVTIQSLVSSVPRC